MLSITPEAPQQDDVVQLLEEAESGLASLYPAESRHGLNAAELERQGVRFFVARLDGRAIGCGGYLPGANLPGANRSAELKRMFTTNAIRGQGFGRAILQAVEESARHEGIEILQLETGVKSTEALGLYRRFGYRERGPFGNYRSDPLSVFMEKRLA